MRTSRKLIKRAQEVLKAVPIPLVISETEKKIMDLMGRLIRLSTEDGKVGEFGEWGLDELLKLLSFKDVELEMNLERFEKELYLRMEKITN